MKKIFLISFLALYTLTTQGKISHNLKDNTLTGVAALSQIHASPSFIENRGQITDQNRKVRHDIQFKISAVRGLNIFIGNGAIHYQFYS